MTEHSAGYTTISTTDGRRSRPVLLDLWYPTNRSNREQPFDYQPGFGLIAKNAPFERHAAPTLVLSHGAFGAARNYSWIAEHLARSGYVVAGVSHYQESFIYGPQTIDPSSALKPWLRAQDCSYALDYLSGNNELSNLVDRDRIGGIGHSSGGATVLEMAGAVLDLLAMQRYCLSEEAAEDKGCQYARGMSATMQPESGPQLLDRRLRAIVAMDPALGPGHTEESLQRISVPTYIIGSVQNDFLPYQNHARRYANLISQAKHTALSNGEGHFIYLNEGKSDAQANGVPLYKDRTGVDRAGVHETLSDLIVSFLDRHLKGA